MTDARDDVARAELIISAARIAINDKAIGDPDVILDGVAAPSLGPITRDAWFAVLLDAWPVGDLARATLAVLVLVYGEPVAADYAWPVAA